jgi:histidyl-tRNA synthetase
MVKAPRGTRDLLPGEIEKWHYIENTARKVCEIYGYQEIRTPIFEYTELFLRGIGDTTDVVQKEMYTFKDRGGRSVTLRPEGTAAVVRAYLEHHLNNWPQPVKLYYLGPMFRYDRPQAGRMRQFHQLGIEAFGSNDPSLDAEVICYTWDFLTEIGLKGMRLELNSVGCPDCRPEFGRALREFMEQRRTSLCMYCQDRLERNPLRLLDCKDPHCQELLKGAPSIHQYLCPECREHFQMVQEYLNTAELSYQIKEGLVRGLDYYTQTAFEVVLDGMGAQSSVAGGGRYNNLVETCGGPQVPGIGVAIGLERVLIALEKQGVVLPIKRPWYIFVATAGKDPSGKLEREVMRLLIKLRRLGYPAEKDFLSRSLKAQMKQAGRLGARFVIIIGTEELQEGKVVLRDMEQGSQKEMTYQEMFGFFEERMNKEAVRWKTAEN